MTLYILNIINDYCSISTAMGKSISRGEKGCHESHLSNQSLPFHSSPDNSVNFTELNGLEVSMLETNLRSGQS